MVSPNPTKDIVIIPFSDKKVEIKNWENFPRCSLKLVKSSPTTLLIELFPVGVSNKFLSIKSVIVLHTSVKVDKIKCSLILEIFINGISVEPPTIKSNDFILVNILLEISLYKFWKKNFRKPTSYNTALASLFNGKFPPNLRPLIPVLKLKRIINSTNEEETSIFWHFEKFRNNSFSLINCLYENINSKHFKVSSEFSFKEKVEGILTTNFFFFEVLELFNQCKFQYLDKKFIKLL